MTLTSEAKYEVHEETRGILGRYAKIFGITNLAVISALAFAMFQKFENWQATQEEISKNKLDGIRSEIQEEADKKIEERINQFLETSKEKLQGFESDLKKSQDRIDSKIDDTNVLIGKLAVITKSAEHSDEKYKKLEKSLGILAEQQKINEAAEFISNYSKSDAKSFVDSFSVTDEQGSHYRMVTGVTEPGVGWLNYTDANKKTFYNQALIKIDTSWASLSKNAIFLYTIQAPYCLAREIESAGTLYTRPGENKFQIFAHGPASWKKTPGHKTLSNGIQSAAEHCKWHIRWVAFNTKSTASK